MLATGGGGYFPGVRHSNSAVMDSCQPGHSLRVTPCFAFSTAPACAHMLCSTYLYAYIYTCRFAAALNKHIGHSRSVRLFRIHVVLCRVLFVFFWMHRPVAPDPPSRSGSRRPSRRRVKFCMDVFVPVLVDWALR